MLTTIAAAYTDKRFQGMFWLFVMIEYYFSHGRFGSLAALRHPTSLMSAFGGKAYVRRAPTPREADSPGETLSIACSGFLGDSNLLWSFSLRTVPNLAENLCRLPSTAVGQFAHQMLHNPVNDCCERNRDS